MKFKVGDKVRIISSDESYYDGYIGHEGTVTLVDGNNSYPYKVDGTDGTLWNDGELELIEAAPVSSPPSPPLTFSKTTILSFPGFIFTLDSEGNVSLRDTDYAEEAISLPFATLVAAVDELRKEATK